jgi:hypothetical protein
MSRRYQTFSKIALAFLLLVVLFTRPGLSYSDFSQSQQQISQSPPDFIDDLQPEYGTGKTEPFVSIKLTVSVIAVEIGEVSRVAVMERGVYVLLVNDRGQRTTPSCINEICLM